MKKHIVYIDGSTRAQKSSECDLFVPFSSDSKQSPLDKYFWENRDLNQLNYSESVIDLYRLAASIYIVDKSISRDESYDRWSRYLSLIFPVHDINKWESSKVRLIELLNFLTGDHWDIEFIQKEVNSPPPDQKLVKKSKSIQAESVNLFSGGLDSFIGSLDTLAKSTSVALVSHSTSAKSIQQVLVEQLNTHFPKSEINLIQFPLQPTNSKEDTTRSRSFLFLTLGTAVASGVGKQTFFVPENGLISLNVPLTPLRLGSLSTKTTHPNTLKLFNELLINIGIDVAVFNPYQFKTKGEMISDSADFEFLKSTFHLTMSCAHPAAARFDSRPPNQNCGYCLPCLIRRASLYRNGLDIAEQYIYDVQQGSFQRRTGKTTHDLHAVLYGIENYDGANSLSKVVSTGSLNPSDISAFVDLYGRGMTELSNFLQEK